MGLITTQPANITGVTLSSPTGTAGNYNLSYLLAGVKKGSWRYNGTLYVGTILTVGSGGDYAGLYDAYDAIAVLTAGKPYLAVGSHPSNVVMEAMDLGHACMSKRGTVQAGDVIIYPSPDGLVAIGPSIREVLTEDIISREDWNNNYNPSSITAFYWEGHYVAFCNVGRRNFGFIFNIKTKELTDLTFYATAGYRDAGTGILFLVK